MSKSNSENTNKGSSKPAAVGRARRQAVKNQAIVTDAAAGAEPARPAAKPKKQRKPSPNAGANKAEEPMPADREADSHNKSPQPEMEVHHHPQLEHKTKPWKEYLLEGFMIFIAVMMGFIAENIRDDINNNEHAGQLTSQLMRDLKADTGKLNDGYRGETAILKSDDSLFQLLQRPLQSADLMKIERCLKGAHSLWPFHPSMGAVAAIKNELHLKQFSNSKIIGYISDYEGHIELLHTVQDIALQYQRSFLDPFLYQHFVPANLDAAFAKSPKLTSQMRDLSQKDLTQLAAQIVLIRINTQELVDDNRKVMKDVSDLLQYVEKQYHPDGE